MRLGDLHPGDVVEFFDGTRTATGAPVPSDIARIGWFMDDPDDPVVAIVHGLVDEFDGRRPDVDFSVSVDVDVRLLDDAKVAAAPRRAGPGGADVDPLRDRATGGPLFGGGS